MVTDFGCLGGALMIAMLSFVPAVVLIFNAQVGYGNFAVHHFQIELARNEDSFIVWVFIGPHPGKGLVAPFIVRYLGWQARSRFLGHLSEMATIRSSGWPLRNAPNGIPRPWRVSQD